MAYAQARFTATNTLLPTRKDQRNHWMALQYKQQRIQRTSMPFAMRLAAITATDTRPGKFWQ